MSFASPHNLQSFVPILPRGAVLDLDALATSMTFSHGTQQQAHCRGKAKGKNKPMSSSERGVKFRQRQQEKQIAQLVSNQDLRHQILRLQTARDLYTQKTLASPCSSAGSSPVKFVLEYFDQFRMGLRVPGAPPTVLSSHTQKDFLNALVEPHTLFGGKPAQALILSIWERYSTFHSSIKLTCESVELIPADTSSSVVVYGTLHLRYSRRTIENVYPHAAAEEDLIQKLIGRQLHVRYRAQMHFNANGKLEAYEMAPDFVGALMEVLGNLRDCERILGRALIKGHVLGEEPDPEDLEPVEILSEEEEEPETREDPPSMADAETPRTCSSVMKIDYILS